MKKWTLLVFCCTLTALLSAQVQPKDGKVNVEVASNKPNPQTDKKPLSEADQLDREFLLQTYTKEGDSQFQKGDYRKALKSYQRIQTLSPSSANSKKLLECQRALHKNIPPEE